MTAFLNVFSLVLCVVVSILTFVVLMISTIGESTEKELQIARRWYIFWIICVIFAISRIYNIAQNN